MKTILILTFLVSALLIFGEVRWHMFTPDFGGTTIAVFQGGTGANTFSSGAFLQGNGTSAITASTSAATLDHVFATSVTATSTFAFGVQATKLNITSGTSTFANGIQLSSGCFRLTSGACAGSGTGNGNVISITTSLFAGTILSTTTSSVSGALTLGTCDSVTSTIPTALMSSTTVIDTTPKTYPGDSTFWFSFVMNATTIVTKECGLGIVTPTATAYNLNIFQ